MLVPEVDIVELWKMHLQLTRDDDVISLGLSLNGVREGKGEEEGEGSE